MANIEKNDEIIAKSGFEYLTNIELSRNDFNGEVDYVYKNDVKYGCLEVFTIINRDFMEFHDDVISDPFLIETQSLKQNWYVWIGTYAKSKYVSTQLFPLLQKLEKVKIVNWREGFEFYGPSLFNESELEILNRLEISSLKSSSEPITNSQKLEFSVVALLLITSSSYGGPNSTLEYVEKHLLDERKHLAKLVRDESINKNLWIWFNKYSPSIILDSFSHGRHQLLPKVGPVNLPKNLALWLFHAETGNGWHWDPKGNWASVNIDMAEFGDLHGQN